MNVLVATDGSRYGGWGLNWVATLPFVKPPKVTVLHVLDVAALRAPFLSQPVMAGTERYFQEEIQRMETRSAKTLKEATEELAALRLKGRVLKVQGAVAPTILKRAPKRSSEFWMRCILQRSEPRPMITALHPSARASGGCWHQAR